MQYIYGGWLITSVLGQINSVDTIAKEGTSLSTLAPSAVWACVALISIIGLIKLYYDSKKDTQDIKDIVKSTTEAITKSNDIGEKTNDILDKISSNMSNCSKKSS